jgi:hypothetical protein
LKRDARCAALVHGDELPEAVARFVVAAALDQRSNLDRQTRIL